MKRSPGELSNLGDYRPCLTICVEASGAVLLMIAALDKAIFDRYTISQLQFFNIRNIDVSS